VHIVELSTAVVKVEIYVINATGSLTQNQGLQCVPTCLNACYDTGTARRHCSGVAKGGRGGGPPQVTAWEG